MATRVTDEFGSRANPPDAAYPDGSLKNETTPGVSNDGSPLESRVGNDFEGFKQSALAEAGITANGNPDSVTNPQILDSVKSITDNRFNADGVVYTGLGNISGVVGQSVPDADKKNAYQYPDNSRLFYGPIQDQVFPITIPSDPSGDNGWALVSASSADDVNDRDSKLIGGKIWPTSGSASVGMTIPSGVNSILLNGKIYKSSIGNISGLIESISTSPALIKVAGITDPTPLVLVDNGDPSTNVLLWGASEFDDGTQNDLAFYACLQAKGSVQVPAGVTLRTKQGWHTTSDHQQVTFAGESYIEPASNDIEVFAFKYDYGTVNNLKVLNSGAFSGCTGLAFTPRASDERVNQRYNRSIFQYIQGVEWAIRLQCGDFVSIADEVSGCWYNRVVGGGELRNCSYGIYLEKGLKSQPTYENPAPNNRNTFSDISMHFITVKGVLIEAGDTNAFNQVQVESCNTAGFVAFEVLLTSPEPQQGNNDRNSFVNCGCESVAQSVNIQNTRTNFTNWMGERNTGDFWGNPTGIDGRQPDRAPYATPISYVQNYPFDPTKELGRDYITLARGVEYSSGSKEAPTPVNSEFEVYDMDFIWQDFNLASAINNSTLTTGIGKYQKSANWIDIAVRARVSSVTGDLTLTLPYQADTSMYVASASGAGFKHPIIVAPGGAPELGYMIFVTSTLVRITAPSSGWSTSNDFNLDFRYKAG